MSDHHHASPKTPSLSQAMSGMAMRMDDLLDAQQRENPALQAGDMPRDLFFWISVDTLLAHLHKQWMDARKDHEKIAQRHGAGDVMSDLAADRSDSAETAFETRLLELKASEEKQAQVNAMMKAALEAEEAEQAAQLHARSKAFWREFSRPKRRINPAAMQASNNIWLALYGLMMIQDLLQQTSRDLSAACDFMRASRAGPGVTLRHAFADSNAT